MIHCILLSLTLLLGADALAQDPINAKTASATPASDTEDTGAEGELDEAAPDEEEEAEPEEPAWAPRWPGEISPDFRHYDLEILYADGKLDEGLRLAKARVAEQPDDPALYWIICRYLFEQGEYFDRTDKSIDKVAHYAEMVSWAEKGLALAPDDYKLRFSRGIANGRLGTTKGVLSSLRLASGVEADWQYAINAGKRYSSIDGSSMLPCDAQLALGIFYRLVPDRWIVSVLTGGVRGSLDKSVKLLEDAVRCGPNRIGPMKELGVTQLCIGTSRKDPEMLEKGKATIREYMKLTPTNERGRIDIRHGQLLLDDPKIACGYSRDGQQDLDAEKLEKK